MWDNVQLKDTANPSEILLTIDRVLTQDYVLDIVDFGVHETTYGLINTLDLIGLEKDIWYKTMSTATITGWVLNDDWNDTLLAQRKMELNRLIEPNKRMIVEAGNVNRNVQASCEILLTQSIRYGTNEKENNDEFCKFLITGVYRQDSFTTQNIS